MEDRLVRGFVAGAIGGVIATSLGHFAYMLGFSALRASDWTAILMFAHVPPFSLGEQLFAWFILLGWCGAVGSMFAYFILRVTSRYILFKGWMLGTTPFFAIYLLTTLFQVPGTVPVPFGTALSNYVMTALFGIIMGYSFKVLDERTVEQRRPTELLAHPATKPIGVDTRQNNPQDEEKNRND